MNRILRMSKWTRALGNGGSRRVGGRCTGGLLGLMLGLLVAVGADTAEGVRRAREVDFSHRRGFFDKAFELTLTTKETGAEIRYTLDGTRPDRSRGSVYTRPIAVARTTIVRAVAVRDGLAASDIKTHTFLFPGDIVQQSADGLPPAGFPYAWGANKVDYGMDARVVGDPKYAAGFAEDLKSIPSFSLVLDLDDLFDRERGIYANASMHGRAMERPASLELIHGDGRKGFHVDCGVRIRGGFSRNPMNAKHSFRVFLRKSYGEGKLDYPLFGPQGAARFDGFDLRTSQNYSWSMGGDPRAVFLRDQFNRDTQLAMGQPAARGDFYHLYLNGQYWGLYNTCERPEADFAASYFGGKSEDYDVMKARPGDPATSGQPSGRNRAASDAEARGAGRPPEMPFPTDGNSAAWRRLYEAAKAGLAEPAAYQRLLGNNPDGTRNPDYEVLLDPVNLVDYMLVILYGGNLDAPVSKFGADGFPNNWFGLRSRVGAHGFKFFIWDAEHTLLDVREDRTGPFRCGDDYPTSNPQWIWQQCQANAEFRLLVADRVQRHCFGAGALTPAACADRFQRRVREIERAVVCESARWGDVTGGPFGENRSAQEPPRTRDADWRPEVERIMKEFFPQRTAVLLDQLFAMGLYPDLAAPVPRVVAAGPSAGSRLEFEPGPGRILFTLDGSDPRRLGGEVAPRVQDDSSGVRIDRPMTLRARRWLAGEWSALTERELRPGATANP